MTNVPYKSGFYWAKVKMLDEGTTDEDEWTPSNDWEVVEIFENTLDTDDAEHLMVFVGGIEQPQSLENMFWGPGPLPDPDEGIEAMLKKLVDCLSDDCPGGDDGVARHNELAQQVELIIKKLGGTYEPGTLQ